MEERAITYEHLVLSTYATEHILDLHLYEQMNTHGILQLTAVIPEEHAEQVIPVISYLFIIKYVFSCYKYLTVSLSGLTEKCPRAGLLSSDG